MVDSVAVSCEVANARDPVTGWDLPLARGIYHSPAGIQPRTAFLAAHYDLDFSHHYLAPLLSARGFGFLGWNTRYTGHGAFFGLQSALHDIHAGVRWLRANGAATVVLLGNSGGGSLMAAYQASATRRREVAEPPGDLYVSVAAHRGRPDVLTNWLDPAATDETDPTSTDPELDMYNPRNGPPYAPEFVANYRRAQQERNDRITSWCRRELERLRGAGYRGRLFSVHRTWADLRFLDGALDPSERQVPGCYRGDPERANRGADGIAAVTSLRTWLEMWSLQNSPLTGAAHLRDITVPSLVIQPAADAGVFPSDARAIFDDLGGADKQLLELPGDHYFRGPPRARENLADQIADWVHARDAGA